MLTHCIGYQRILDVDLPLGLILSDVVKYIGCLLYTSIDTGMKPGRELGEMLQQLLELVLEHPEQNTREQLLEKVKELSADKD